MAFRDSASFEADNTTGSSTITIPIPGTVQVGDVAVLAITMNATAATTLTATGWTQRVAQTTMGTAAYWVFTRTVQSGDTTVTVTSSVARFFTALAAWWSSPGFDVIGTAQTRPGVQSTTTALSTTSSSGTPQAIAIFVDKTSGLQGAAALSKGTQRAFIESAGSNVNCSVLMMDFAPGATVTGDAVATYAGTANANGAAVQLALLPTSVSIPIVAASNPTSSASLALTASRPLTLTSPGSALAALVISRAVPLTMSSTPTSSAAALLVRSAALQASSLALSQPFLVLGNASPIELSASAGAAASLVLTSTAPLSLSVSAQSIVRLRLPASAHDSGVTERRSTAGSTESLRLAGPTQALEGAPTYG
jgi:hypothetical protein